MKFETKITKLEIDENEVKSIIANCECGEVNGAYLIDLTKEKKESIMEIVGNYLDDGSEDFGNWTDIKRISTFCKTFGITEEEIADYYVLGFNEGAVDIAYKLESNKDVLLVLTDDERYNNSFIQYSPSQQEEFCKEEIAKETCFLNTMRKMDKIEEVIKICRNVDDAHLVEELECKKLRLIQEMTHVYSIVYQIEAKHSVSELFEAEGDDLVLLSYENLESIREQLGEEAIC